MPKFFRWKENEEIFYKPNFSNLFHDACNYDSLFDNPNDKELNDLLQNDEKLPPIPSLEVDKKLEVKTVKILIPNKLSTKFPVLFAQIKAGNNSYKRKNEIRQIVYLLYQDKKSTKNFNH